MIDPEYAATYNNAKKLFDVTKYLGAGGNIGLLGAKRLATTTGDVITAAGSAEKAVSKAAIISSSFGSGGSSGDDSVDEGAESKVKSVDDILDGATVGRVTKGKTTQYVKPGDFNRASNEFDSLNLSNVKNINTPYGQGKTGTLPDGRTVTVRPGSTDGRPTLEIRNSNGRGIEIRYGE